MVMKYKIVRTITYESNSINNLLSQLTKSLPDGEFNLLTKISIKSDLAYCAQEDKGQIITAIMSEPSSIGD